MENYFIFNGISSRDFSIKCSAPPVIVPEKNRKRIYVAGRSGSLTLDEESYKNITKEIKCRLYGAENIGRIASWLRGMGQIIFSSEPSRYYEGYVLGEIVINYILKDYRAFDLKFCCKPFQYFADFEEHLLNFNRSPFLFYGKGNIHALPKIKLYGQGDITLRINGKEIILKDIEEYVVIDSEIQHCFKDNLSMNHKMQGNFPVLLPLGYENTIAFEGNIEKIQIEPRWREV